MKNSIYWTIEFAPLPSGERAKWHRPEADSDIPPHARPCAIGAPTIGQLVELLAARSLNPDSLTRRGNQYVRIETTARGFNAVRFSTRAAAAADDLERAREILPGGGQAPLRRCPFCDRSDRLSQMSWSNEFPNEEEYQGPAVICGRCQVISPLGVWQSGMEVQP